MLLSQYVIARVWLRIIHNCKYEGVDSIEPLPSLFIKILKENKGEN
nr:MAG TPA: hypothetical protein [Caudoviricetes sp.]